MDDKTRSTIPLSGKLLKAVIGSFCLKPINGDDSWPHNSIGVALDSIVATDSRSAVMIGKRAPLHVATSRKEALLEAERASLYGQAVELEEIDRNCTKEGEAQAMPYIQEVITKELASMKPIATVNPKALAAIAKIADAAGALSVDLFQPDGNINNLGFRFTFEPGEEHINLFSEWEGSIDASGVFHASKASVAAETPSEQEELTEDTKPEAPQRKRRQKSVIEVEPVAAEAEPVVESIPVDRMVAIPRGRHSLPPLSVLGEIDVEAIDTGDFEKKIPDVLRSFNVPSRIAAAHSGPTVTMYEVQVAEGSAVKRVAALADDLQYALAVKSIRVQAPIPGKQAIGIEVPNAKPRTVGLSELCATHAFTASETRLLIALGLDLAGRPVYADLSAMPHLLIAGATNAGKSIGVAAILTSLLLRNTPDELRLVLIDPKKVELSLFEEIPHLMCPVVTDMKEVPGILRALVREMEHRYDLLQKARVRNLSDFNAKAVDDSDRLPSIVVVIDELADLMLQAKAECEDSIIGLAQKARAVGIHLIIATQRPSVDVITGVLKANVPSRIAFAVATQIDSRVILDSNGAEKLLGRGDLLFSPITDGGRTTRLQGPFVSVDDVDAVCQHWRSQEGPRYDIVTAEPDDDGEDALYSEAYDFVVDRGQCSTSMLQRRFSIGFQRASRLQDQLEERGVIGPRDGLRTREVLVAKGGGSK